MESTSVAEIQQYLRAIDYPASKQALVAEAEALEADEDILELIAQLADREYQNPAEVSQAIEEMLN